MPLELPQENPYRQLIADSKEENETLRKRLVEVERNCRLLIEKILKMGFFPFLPIIDREKIYVYEQERKKMQSEMFLLQQKFLRENEKLEALQSQKCTVEKTLECDEERQVDTLPK